MRILTAIALSVLTLSACNAFTDLEDEHGAEFEVPDEEPDNNLSNTNAQNPRENPSDECLPGLDFDIELLYADEHSSCIDQMREVHEDLTFEVARDGSDSTELCLDTGAACYESRCLQNLRDCLDELADRQNESDPDPDEEPVPGEEPFPEDIDFPDLIDLAGCNSIVEGLAGQGFYVEEVYEQGGITDEGHSACVMAARTLLDASEQNQEDQLSDFYTEEEIEAGIDYMCREGLFQCV